MTHHEIEDMLYHRSGLLGVSGKSADARALLEDGSPEAAEALNLMCLRIAGEIGRMCSTIGGLDTLVFTAGIGEHQPKIRADIAARLSWLGVELDDQANVSNAERISSHESGVKVFVIPTNEEQIIANDTLSVSLK
jgi:acetate kinase